MQTADTVTPPPPLFILCPAAIAFRLRPGLLFLDPFTLHQEYKTDFRLTIEAVGTPLLTAHPLHLPQHTLAQPSFLHPPTMKIRPAVNDDFNAIMAIATATSSTDSLWNLLLPRAAFKDAAFKEHVSQLLKFYIDPNNTDWLVTVVELPEKDITPGAPSVASFAIWDMTNAGSNTAAKSTTGEESLHPTPCVTR